jgi:hypothetical protein
MDLNYLFYRQQVETSRARSAQSDVARAVHGELAKQYEKKISEAAGQARCNANAPMSLAITAQEVRRRDLG